MPDGPVASIEQPTEQEFLDRVIDVARFRSALSQFDSETARVVRRLPG